MATLHRGLLVGLAIALTVVLAYGAWITRYTYFASGGVPESHVDRWTGRVQVWNGCVEIRDDRALTLYTPAPCRWRTLTLSP